jgi:hypothetical protein
MGFYSRRERPSRLLRPHDQFRAPTGSWVVEKPGFRFDYDEQRIVPGHPHATACDNVVADAIDVADELGIQIGGLNLFVERDWREFNTRPSRSWAAQFYLNDK